MKSKWPYLLLIFISLILLRNLFVSGFPDTHDGHNHVARLANLWLTLRAGQFPPRFAPNLDHGFGYPVFNFNYYLPLLLAVIFKLFKVVSNFEASLKAAFISFYIIGGWGIYTWLSKYLKKPLAILAAIVYLTTPCQLVNIFVRGNIGEVAALGILPWTFWALDKIKSKIDNSSILDRNQAFVFVFSTLSSTFS